ncbi:hypothetical protein BGZ61DRAFT_533406 [Ilyonectria robusta]|uniref:uncharacterized protein n=1 Tax=Ilyonectria robusta TaxID=1079257 RepID=UPI001E8CA22E|nr:uncharacterized protein BGZ61DRAFT_533406 [Ilyonectria robusta]KAH8686711.1 hypothetical protein BGZ61DRAFT_533406 [Ilyonectria robusta]
MDPFSVAGTSIALAGTITTLTTSLIAFIRDVRDARGDVEEISLELHSLKMILELLANDSTVLLPLIIETQLDSVLSNCTRLVGDISQCIQQHQGSRLQKGLRWVAIGRGDMANLRSTLEAHKTTLNLLLEKVNQTKLQEVDCTTLEIKTRTEALFQHTKAIKTDTSRILEVVESLARLYANTLMSVAQTPPACMLERYLDESTTYAKSGIGESTTEITAEDHKVSNSFRPRPCGGPDAMQC